MTLGLHRGHDDLQMYAGDSPGVERVNGCLLTRRRTPLMATCLRGYSQPALPVAGPRGHLDGYSADAMSQPEWSSRHDSPARSSSMVRPRQWLANL